MRFVSGSVSLELIVPTCVYISSDDTELLAAAALQQAKAGQSFLEIGTGSGAVILALAKSGKDFSQMAAVDISKEAVRAAKENAKDNGISCVRFLLSDLFDALPASSKYDLLLFNPPYLPTSKQDKVKGLLNAALDGGPDGLKIVRKFLAQAGAHLAPQGKILLVVSSLQPKDKLKVLMEKYHFSHLCLESKSFFFEKLEVWELRAISSTP